MVVGDNGNAAAMDWVRCRSSAIININAQLVRGKKRGDGIGFGKLCKWKWRKEGKWSEKCLGLGKGFM